MRTDVTLRFWRHIFGGQRGKLAVWSARRASRSKLEPNSERTRYFDYPAEAEAARSYALSESGAGRETYFCAHLLTSELRRKENSAPVAALWGDSDGVEIPANGLKPTALVESSPGHYHVYYRLADAVPPEVAEGLNKRLARKIGADPSGFDLSQLLRVPGTTNYKYDERPVVGLLELDDSRSYSPAELDATLPAAEEPEKVRHATPTDEPPVHLEETQIRVWRGENPKLKENGEVNRSASLVKIGRVIFDAGATRPAIVAALAERDEALGWHKYTARPDADTRYHEIVDELESNGRNGTVRVMFGTSGRNEPSFNLTERGNAERLIHRHGRNLRYCFAWGKWLVWDGRRWTLDLTGEV